MIRPCVSSQSQPRDVVEASGWPKMKVGIGKGVNAMTVNLGLDHAGRGENRGDSGRAIPLNPTVFQKSGCVAFGYWGCIYSHFSGAGGGRYTKKPYTLEKSGIAVKEKLEK